jgi:tungstate transport system substrate-binding protein
VIAAAVSRYLVAAILAILTGSVLPAAAQPVNPSELIVLSTTTTQDSGILRVLTDAFARKSGLAVKAIVAGSGDILKQGGRGEGDVLLTHSPEAEKAWMADGNGTSRRLVMYNDFVIIGPAGDPARIKGLKPADALKRIAETRAKFVSRGDLSGTHVRERALWKRAGIEPKGQPWYYETGQGQGLTMDVAAQFQAYALTDRGTYLVQAKRLGLPILVENDPALYNLYHVMPVNAAKFPKVNAAGAQAFADWLVAPEGQAVIAEFGKAEYGRSLFLPAANKREDELVLK